MKANKPLKIFIVNEDLPSFNIYTHGYTDVSIFNNGIDCLHHITQKPDIIFLDQGKNVAGSLEVLKKIKQIDFNVFVIFMADQEDMQIAIDVFKYGAFEYVIKTDNPGKNIKYLLNKVAQIEDQLYKYN